MKECIYYLLIQPKAAHNCPVPCALVVYIFLVILFSFVIVPISNYFMYALCVSGAVNTQGFVWKFFMRYI